MKRWLNPRVLVVALSILVMVQVSKVGDPHTTIRNDWVACVTLCLLYAAVFLWPLQRCFGARAIAGDGVLLLGAWGAVALALIADALPSRGYPAADHPHNWPMIAFCAAGFAGFFLFFTQMSKSFALRDEVLEARGAYR